MKTFQPAKPIVHFGPEYGVFYDRSADGKPDLLALADVSEWNVRQAADRIRQQGGVPIIKQRMVYHSDWEQTDGGGEG